MTGHSTESFDVAVVGAGIAGASAAAELAQTFRVVLLERESQPGYHSTGRSAAQFSRVYGPPVIRALSRASGSFLENPPSEFSEGRLLAPRGVLTVGDAAQADAVEAEYAELAPTGAVRRVSTAEALEMMPLLRAERAAHAFIE